MQLTLRELYKWCAEDGVRVYYNWNYNTEINESAVVRVGLSARQRERGNFSARYKRARKEKRPKKREAERKHGMGTKGGKGHAEDGQPQRV